jgi:hypothetical protein
VFLLINFYDHVPSVYPSASRDFQYLSWLFNIVLNSVKHNVDDIYNLPNTESDPKLAELLAMTLGFKVKRNYDKKQLTALVAILPSILKYKGTEKAIRIAAEALVMATGSLGDASTELNGTEILVVLPKDLSDITLFLDLLNYILPAGMTCRVVRKNETKKNISDVKLKHSDTLNLLVTDDLAWIRTDDDTRSVGLSGLYDLESAMQGTPDFTANIKNIDGSLVVNAGLLDNTIIPTLDGSRMAEVVQETVQLLSTETDAAGNFTGYKVLYADSGDDGKLLLKAKKTAKEL